MFDEFIIDTTTSQQRYIADEVTAFFELYESVARPGARDYDVRCWFLGNAISQTNPYFDYLDLSMPFKSDIWKRGDMLVQLVAPPELIKAKKNTRFYKALGDCAYTAYATENKFLRDRDTFIMKKSKDAEYQFTFGETTETAAIYLVRALTNSAERCMLLLQRHMNRTRCC